MGFGFCSFCPCFCFGCDLCFGSCAVGGRGFGAESLDCSPSFGLDSDFCFGFCVALSDDDADPGPVRGAGMVRDADAQPGLGNVASAFAASEGVGPAVVGFCASPRNRSPRSPRPQLGQPVAAAAAALLPSCAS